MAKGKQLIFKSIDDILSLHNMDDEFDPDELTQMIVSNCPDIVQEYLEYNNYKIINEAVKAYLKRMAGIDFYGYDSIGKQRVFDFDIPQYLSFRSDNGKAKYIKSMSAKYKHFILAADERFKQSSHDAEKGKRFQRVARFLSANTEITLGQALSQIDTTMSNEEMCIKGICCDCGGPMEPMTMAEIKACKDDIGMGPEDDFSNCCNKCGHELYGMPLVGAI